MSVVIRLQNLPVSAKSADIRNFFGGLRIPSGGVHIIGGEKGEVFVAFNSDEDARLAMRKDGGKIKDSRVKLYLSSRMEMQFEVERITRNRESHKLPFHKSRSPDSPSSDMRHLFPEKMYESERSSDFQWGNHHDMESHFKRSRSPNELNSITKSRSPRRRMRSYRSPSPLEFKGLGQPSSNISINRDMKPSYSWRDSQFDDGSKLSPSTKEIQAQLEKRIAEAIESNPILMSRCGMSYQENVSNVDSAQGNVPDSHSYNPSLNFQTIPFSGFPNESSYSLHTNEPQMPQNMPPSQLPNHAMFTDNVPNTSAANAFYVAVSGLDPLWDFHQIQTIFNPIYLTPDDVRWEIDNCGLRTGAAFIKLLNRNDYETVIRRATFSFYDRLLTISDCHPSLVSQYFFDVTRPSLEQESSEDRNLCYGLKGLPFHCTYDDVVSFFSGLQVADVIISYGKNGKATGSGFVSFKTWKDFKAAYSQNKNKIHHRFIEMFRTTDEKMAKAREEIYENESFSVNRTIRSLCAVITGLPYFTSIKKLIAFFDSSGLKADAIHLIVTSGRKGKKCDGRAFIEFTNFRDFDSALKLNGTMFQEGIMICVKQVLFDEMVNILNSQKAKHHYNVPELQRPELAYKPEKVPYLWEPPDAVKEQNKDSTRTGLDEKHFSSHDPTTSGTAPQMNQFNFPPPANFHDPRMYHVDQPFFPAPDLQASNQPLYPAPPDLQATNQLLYPAPPDLQTTNQLLYPVPSDINTIQVTDIPMYPVLFPPRSLQRVASMDPVQDNFNSDMTPNPKQSFNRNAFRKHRVLSQIPLHQVVTETKGKNSTNKNANRSGAACTKNVKSEETAREPIKFNVNKSLGVNAQKNKTFETEEGTEKKSKLSKLSPQKEINKDPPAKDALTGKNDVSQTQQDKKCALASENKSSPKGKTRSKKKFYKKNQNKKLQQQRKRYFSPPRHMPCVVQMSNVSIDVITQDLKNFLHGFAYDPESIIRRYTDNGEPTGDVRITFLNKKEADLAFKSLNGCYLKNMQINMFAL